MKTGRQRAIQEGKRLLKTIKLEQKAPTGHKHIREEVLKTDIWKYKKEHYKELKVPVPDPNCQAFANEVENETNEFMSDTKLAKKIEIKQKERHMRELER